MDLVECRSDSEYAERPIAFFWDGERLAVEQILDRRRMPEGKRFTVQAVGGGIYDLVYDQAEDAWTVSPR